MAFKLTFKHPVSGRVVFVDGLARAGKSLVGRVLSHLEMGDHWQSLDMIQTMCHTHFLGGIATEVATMFIRNFVDENTYFLIIGRNLNTRPGDMSCIHRGAGAEECLNRENGPEGWDAIEPYRRDNRFPVYQIHNVLRSAPLMFEALPWAEWVHVMRHPAEQAHRWHARGWGVRELVDPLCFSILIDTPHGHVPWYAAKWAELFLSLNPMERAVESVLRLHEEDDLGYDLLSKKQKAQIHRICLEDMVFDPDPVIEGISNFLKAPVLEPMKEMLIEERCPRPNDLKARRACFNEVMSEINPKLTERLYQAAKAYEERWGQDTITS